MPVIFVFAANIADQLKKTTCLCRQSPLICRWSLRQTSPRRRWLSTASTM